MANPRRTNQKSDPAASWDIESLVRSAGAYVQPSSDLRPRTLEAAAERRTRRRGLRSVLLVAGCLLLVPLLYAIANPLAVGFGPRGYSAEVLNQRADELVRHGGVDPSWGLFEALRLLRLEQAAQFRPASRQTEASAE